MKSLDIDKVILCELILAYQMNIEFDKDEGGVYMERDEDLLDALEKTIEYYSSPDEFISFTKQLKFKRESNAKAIR